ncbi:mitochondrial group I intron splicing factor [Acrasis kona]|uniref:Mitochondrial group I intron splicing factor n=1 Tax=Acrasis kona TaxID=1008807 RepID=A0AAW2ZHV1_9EUKA
MSKRTRDDLISVQSFDKKRAKKEISKTTESDEVRFNILHMEGYQDKVLHISGQAFLCIYKSRNIGRYKYICCEGTLTNVAVVEKTATGVTISFEYEGDDEGDVHNGSGFITVTNNGSNVFGNFGDDSFQGVRQ